MRKSGEIQISAVARLFSSSVLNELAGKGKSPLFARLVRESRLLEQKDVPERIFELFESAFAYMKHRRYRHEYIYKAALTQKVLLGTHSLQTASMLSEFRVGACKADIVILNGTGTAYEIKSERDTLSRLERQVSTYMRVFATVNVIVGENHVDAVLASVPADVGVMMLSDRYQISTVRDGQDVPSRTCPNAIFDSINLREAKTILEDLGNSLPDVPNTRQYQEYRSRFIKLDPEAAHLSMVRTLKRTRNLEPLATLIDELPSSLHSAALSARLRRQDHHRLVSAMKTPLNQAMMWA